jgi:tetratricopeptide (TPR) repeat protein
MTFRSLQNIVLPFLMVGFFATTSQAQDIDRAVGAFQSGNYEDSASLFYAILRFEEDPSLIAESQYGLAASFAKLNLHLAALKYYENIVREGSDHPYFDKGVEGLLDVAQVMRDDLKIPPVIDMMYEDNISALEKMNPEILQRVHYVIGKNSFNRGNVRDARDFLSTVKPGNPAYAQAQYLLGLIRLGVGRADNPKPKYEKAFEHFRNTRDSIPLKTEDERLRILRDMAVLGIARTHYEQAYLLEEGDPKREKGLRSAIRLYRLVPRFSDAWPQALFERGWAHTVSNEYGKALGALHSLEAPYFEEYFYPEANILRAIIYYYNCQWDRVNDVLEETKGAYQPLVERLQVLLEQDYEWDEWYVLLNKSLEAGKDHNDERLIPFVVARHLSQDSKYKTLELFLRELEHEAQVFGEAEVFSRSEMGREMTDFALETRKEFLKVIGRYIKTKLAGIGQELNDITTRASLVSLETKTAETQWLEQGREISGQVRSRLPRPAIPDETFQFWWFRDEYWIDELGYYEYSIKTECY